MPNDTDVEDVEGPPEAGFQTDQDQAPLAGPAGAGLSAAAPAPQAAPQQQMGGGNIQSLLQGGLAGLMQPLGGPNVGPMVQQRHGGLLTGLAGVLLDGLASGMAPDAETAARMPMIRQQQAMQQQQMQMQQQKMQEEMRLQPVRDKLILADAQMKLMQLDHAAMEMTTENQLGLSDFYRDFIQKKITANSAEEVASGSVDDMKAYLRQQNDPTLFPWYKERDAQGKVTKASVVKLLPEAWSPAVKSEHDYTDPVSGKKYPIKLDVPAGRADVQASEIGKQLSDQYAAIGAQSQPAKTPAQGVMQAINRAQQAGKSGQAVFDDPDVQTAIKAVQATEKPGGGFESEAYGQYVQGEQAKGRQPLSMVEFQRQLWPQTQIALGGLNIRKAAEARQEAAAQYQATDPTGRPVAGSMAELQAAGIPISKITKQTAVQQQQTDAARDMISPDGLFAIARRQMMDLDAKGKLGPIASRWNNFWARKGLDGDQQAFRNTLDLLGSRLMAAHLQRTNVSALEHFGKMIPENSTPTAFKKELNEEYKYVVGQSKMLGGPAAQ